jgi:putative ATP-dependent endonuclease of OLD family
MTRGSVDARALDHDDSCRLRDAHDEDPPTRVIRDGSEAARHRERGGGEAVIERIIIQGYRRFARLDFEPISGMNIIVGDNESGKSTLLEAIALALTGKVNGRWASEELNPFWFHRPTVLEYFDRYGTEKPCGPPELLIELYLSGAVDAVQHLRGVHNSRGTDCPGVSVRAAPLEEYRDEFKAYMDGEPPAVLPVEFYEVDWRSFSDERLHRRPRELATSYIDSRTIRSTAGVDHHTREMLSEHLEHRERAEISLAHRKSRQEITDGTLGPINTRIAEQSQGLHHNPIGLQMDQSARTSWETGIVPQVQEIPFAMAGQGQQATIKLSLAMSRTAGASTFVLIEEPENHLSHTNLTRLIARIESLATENQQLFIGTHSSFVLNRLGVDRLVLLHDGVAAKLSALEKTTVEYFRKLAGYDTLRLALAEKVALVEGPSDVIVFERAFRDAAGKLPMDFGIDVISMGGLTFKRALELCAALGRHAVALQDNDGRAAAEVQEPLESVLAGGKRELFVSDPDAGRTLEPQLLHANSDDVLRDVLKLRAGTDVGRWMGNNKTEAALRIFDSETTIVMPDYIERAVGFLL